MEEGAGVKRILVIGGGFAGLHLVRRLERHRLRPDEARLTLLDRNNFHLFTPLLYQVATGELPPHAVAYPLRVPLARAGNEFVRTEVTAIDLERRVVTAGGREFPYDIVVIAPGSVTNDFGIPGVKEHALTVKWLSDGRAVRHRILSVFEDAARETDAQRRRELLSFVIVGAGPVGVELSASMRDLMEHNLRRIYPSIDFDHEPHITIVDASDRMLPQMDPRLSRVAAKRMGELGVDVLMRQVVAEVGPHSVRTKDGSVLTAHTVIWAGGVRANPLLAPLDVPKTKDGRLIVDELFRVDGRDDVLSFGDAAAFMFEGKPLPQLAQVAVLQAPGAAANLAHLVRGEPLQRFAYHRKGDLIALGRTKAGVEFAKLGHLVLSGFLAWTVWRANYLMQLVGVRNRGTLLLEWILSYFSRRIIADIQ
ncbi:MAG TPA: NAD(P)/FAD-dependent oxidoreductase [Candidatus Acidoferrales bacterium]|nr:NAD(P)/FAD-dependent oxidoreductase [Candidatus Acidoferrales bacterium]